jgi:biopolymer transport protein ExbD
MAEKRQFLDVWIVEANTVYREVPYAVVSDWIQQGRLLENDQLRHPGTSQWFKIGAMPEMAAFLPRAEPYRAEDQAEALEPVQVDFAWRRPQPDEDEDVDMIPLIDVSLVLLIFFMMTASVIAAGSLINTPVAEFGNLVTATQLWIGIDRQADGSPLYSIGAGDAPPKPEHLKLDERQVLGVLDQVLDPGQPKQVQIRGDRHLPYEVIQSMTLALELRKSRGIEKVFAEVSTRNQP